MRKGLTERHYGRRDRRVKRNGVGGGEGGEVRREKGEEGWTGIGRRKKGRGELEKEKGTQTGDINNLKHDNDFN